MITTQEKRLSEVRGSARLSDNTINMLQKIRTLPTHLRIEIWKFHNLYDDYGIPCDNFDHFERYFQRGYDIKLFLSLSKNEVDELVYFMTKVDECPMFAINEMLNYKSKMEEPVYLNVAISLKRIYGDCEIEDVLEFSDKHDVSIKEALNIQDCLPESKVCECSVPKWKYDVIIIYLAMFVYYIFNQFVIKVVHQKVKYQCMEINCLCKVCVEKEINYSYYRYASTQYRLIYQQSMSRETRKLMNFYYKYRDAYRQQEMLDYLMHLLEDSLYFVAVAIEDNPKRRRADQIIFALCIFAKIRHKGFLLDIIMEQYIPYLTTLLKSPETTQSFENGLHKLRSVYEQGKTIKNAALFTKLHRCTMFLLSFSILEKAGITMDTCGFTKIEQAFNSKKYSNKTDFFMCVMDTVIFLLERGYQVYKTGDVSTILHTSNEYQQIFDDCADLQYKERFLSNPEAGGFTECEYRAKLDDTIEKLTNINKHCYDLSKFDKELIKQKLFTMKMLFADLTTKKEGRKNRDAPFGVAIFSPPGMGKTTLTKMLSTFFCRIRGLPTGDQYFYTRNAADPFWSGFVSSVHTLILDDIASENPDLKDPKSVNEIIQIMNNAAFCPNQAELEMKGRTPLRVKNVIATTNVKDYNAYIYCAVPSAVIRRLPFVIIPTVKPEYLSDRGMLDSTKVEPGPFPDLWTFTVEKIVCRKAVNATELRRLPDRVNILTDANQHEFFSWLRDAINDFEVEQKKIKTSMEETVNAAFCTCCNLPEVMCAGPSRVESYPMLDRSLFMLYLFVIIGVIIRAFVAFKNKYRKFYLSARFYLGIASPQEIYELFATVSRQYFTNIGDKMMNKLNHPKFFLSAVSVIVSIIGFSYMQKRPQKVQGTIDTNIGDRPQAESNGRENVWYKNEMELSELNLTRQSQSSKSNSFADFQKKIFKNVVSLEIDIPNTESYMPCQALCLGGQVYITNNHNVPEGDVLEVRFVPFSKQQGVTGNQRFKLTKNNIRRYPERDIVVIYITCVPPKKNITDLFVKKNGGIYNGAYIKNVKGQCVINETRNIRFHPHHEYNIEIKGNFDTLIGYPRVPTDFGDCGSPILLQSNFGYAIGGIHVASNQLMNTSFALALDQEFVNTLFNSDVFVRVESGSHDLLSAPSADREVVPLHHKSVFRYLHNGTATLYGSFAGFRGKSSSRVEATPMSAFLTKEGYKIKFFKPEMKSWEPWHIVADKMVSKKAEIRTDILDMCVKGYISDVMSKLEDPENIHMCMVLDDFTAINGAQVAYIDKMNRNTSAGNPWKKNKKYFLNSIEPAHGMLDPVEVDSEIMERVVDIIDRAKRLECSHPNFCAHLKDEPVSLKKARMKKTRVFTGAPMDYIIVVRKFCLGFVRLVQNERFAFEAAPGTIAQSLEWEQLYTYLIQFGENRMVAGDFVGYDTSQVPPEVLAAFKIIYHFSKMSGNFTEEELNVIAVLAYDTAFALVDYNGDLVMFHGINPSGNPLTVVLNCLVNSLRTRYVYYLLNPNKEIDSFRNNVNLMTYGDDNIMGISESVPWFNHTTISEAYGTMNIEYTMADKESASVPYINISEADFLKRKWRYDDVLKCHVAPLHHDSIEKMLMVWTKSKSVPCEVQGISVISSALSEYFFYGKEVFEEKRNLFRKLVDDLDWCVFVEDSTFPTYEELCLRFQMCSKHCALYNKFY
jgi:hypothetical protein